MLNVTCESPTSVVSSELIDEILADLNLGDDPFPDPGPTLTDEENDQLDAYIRLHDLAYSGRETRHASLNKFRPLSDVESSANRHKKKVSDVGGNDSCPVSPVSPLTPSPCYSHTFPAAPIAHDISTQSLPTPEAPLADTPSPPNVVQLDGYPPVSLPLISGKSGMTLEEELAWLDAYIQSTPLAPVIPTGAPVNRVRPESWPDKIKRWEAERLAALRVPTILLPARWRSLNAAQQYVVAARVPDATALTLNLSPAVEKVARAHADSLAYVVKRVNRYLAAAGLSRTPYALTLEISPNNRLHLHGVILVADVDPKNLKRALMKAGGKIAGRAGSRQMKLEPITNPDGWASYTGKDRKLTAKIIPGRRLVSLSQAMSRIARQHHEASLPAPKPRKRRKT